MTTLKQWQREVFPNGLGDDEHRWSWIVGPSGRKDIMWLHHCEQIGKWATCLIDLTTGERHRLVSEHPLTLEPSILCPIGCGDHGFVRDDRWIAA